MVYRRIGPHFFSCFGIVYSDVFYVLMLETLHLTLFTAMMQFNHSKFGTYYFIDF